MKLIDAKIRKCDKLKPIAFLKNSIKISEKNSICINPTLLFTRLSAIAQREDDVEGYFEFELATFPLSLFKNGLMRKPDKASLHNVLLSENNQSPKPTTNCVHTVDGGALLHRVHWVKNMTFDEVAKIYVDYVKRNYGLAHVVFDGYDSSTKSSDHLRRQMGETTPDVTIKGENLVPYTKDHFISSTNNKRERITFFQNT